MSKSHKIKFGSLEAMALGINNDTFYPSINLYLHDNYVYIYAIASRKKGNFLRLVNLIFKKGHGIKIVAPLAEMLRIVQKCNYTRQNERHYEPRINNFDVAFLVENIIPHPSNDMPRQKIDVNVWRMNNKESL